MNALKLLPNYTYKDSLVWHDRWELINGLPYAMSPAPIPKHQLTGANLMYEFGHAIRKQSCKNCKVYEFLDYLITNDTVLQPDCIIVCKPIKKAFLDFAPNIVIEILSPATAIKDRNIKFKIYEKQCIPYFLILDPKKELIEVYALNAKGKYVLKKLNKDMKFSFTLNEGCVITVSLFEIWY